MAASITSLISQACAVGVQIGHAADGELTLRAPKIAGPLARALRAREFEVLQLFNWTHARVAEPAPCVLCRRPAILRDPVENRPCHKVCVDALIRPTRSEVSDD